MLGIRNETAGSVHSLHTPSFRLDEAALPLGAALHARFAVDFLNGDGDSSSGSGGAAAAGEAERPSKPATREEL
jgi:IAA-amino acid hydrolase